MKRKKFLKTLLGASALITMDGFSTLANAIAPNNSDNNSTEFASYGAIHLNNTSLEKSTHFWTKIVGMKQRKVSENMAEFGTETTTLVVVHQTATKAFKKGYSGLYHFAIHAPNLAEFASMIQRLNTHKYPYAPIDHTMSKSIYLDDPDGINVEFTLETPERFKRVVTTGGLRIEGTDGVIRSASEHLEVNEILKILKGDESKHIISKDTFLGHVHLYANNVVHSNTFYKQIGFLQFNYLPQYMYADLSAGGTYQHRIVMNSWHGTNKPLAPKENAGLRHFQINYKNKEKFTAAIAKLPKKEEKNGDFWTFDPTGNKILLTNKT